MLVCLTIALISIGEARGGESASNWASPSATTVRRASALFSAQHEPVFLRNMDCTLLTYRTTTNSTLQTGCFTPTAFGLVDSDSGDTIFTGTDEAVSLRPNVLSQVLVPWPNALNLLVLQPDAVDGAYLTMYKNPLAHLSADRNALLQVTAQQLNTPPDSVLRDHNGEKLILNPATIAFSDGGSWLVAESLRGSFVRINLATLDVLSFAPQQYVAGATGTKESRVAISSDGTYVALANPSTQMLEVYDLTNCQPYSRVRLECPHHNYYQAITQGAGAVRTINHLRFTHQELLSLEVLTPDDHTSGTYLLAPRAGIDSLLPYIGLGDSYTSGEGAHNYTAESDTASNRCHVSVHAYPSLLTRDIFGSNGGGSVACSGARSRDVGDKSNSYTGQVRDKSAQDRLAPQFLATVYRNFLPGYIAQRRFVEHYQPQVTTVSIGGNDIGFAAMLTLCASPRFSQHMSDWDCFTTYEDRQEALKRIDRQVSAWTTLFSELVATNPLGKLYVVGYPLIAVDTGACATNVRLSQSELAFSIELTVRLNNRLQQAARNAHVPFIDVSQAFAGHRLCEARSSAVAVNGLTAGTDGMGIFGSESYHPNALGHQLLEQAILTKTHNFTDHVTAATPVTPTPSAATNAAPHTGKTLPNRTFAALTQPFIHLGAVFHIETPQALFAAHTPVYATIDGDTGHTLQAAVSDDTGTVVIEPSLPLDTPPGGHTLEVVGVASNGEAASAVQPIFVPVHPLDYDGDGIPNTDDGCPVLAQNDADDACVQVAGSTTHPQPPAASVAIAGTTSTATPTRREADVHTVQSAPKHTSHTLKQVAKPTVLPAEAQTRDKTTWQSWNLPRFLILWLCIWALLVLLCYWALRLVGLDRAFWQSA